MTRAEEAQSGVSSYFIAHISWSYCRACFRPPFSYIRFDNASTRPVYPDPPSSQSLYCASLINAAPFTYLLVSRPFCVMKSPSSLTDAYYPISNTFIHRQTFRHIHDLLARHTGTLVVARSRQRHENLSYQHPLVASDKSTLWRTRKI